MDRTRIVDFVWYFMLCFIIYVLFSYTIYVVLLLLLLYVTRLLLDRETEIKDSAVLITGCDSGNMKYSLVHILKYLIQGRGPERGVPVSCIPSILRI